MIVCACLSVCERERQWTAGESQSNHTMVFDVAKFTTKFTIYSGTDFKASKMQRRWTARETAVGASAPSFLKDFKSLSCLCVDQTQTFMGPV